MKKIIKIISTSLLLIGTILLCFLIYPMYNEKNTFSQTGVCTEYRFEWIMSGLDKNRSYVYVFIIDGKEYFLSSSTINNNNLNMEEIRDKVKDNEVEITYDQDSKILSLTVNDINYLSMKQSSKFLILTWIAIWGSALFLILIIFSHEIIDTLVKKSNERFDKQLKKRQAKYIEKKRRLKAEAMKAKKKSNLP